MADVNGVLTKLLDISANLCSEKGIPKRVNENETLL